MDHSLFSLTDRVAVVTGAGRGIGKAIAIALANSGTHVVCAARTYTEIEATASEVNAKGREALAVPTDVTSSTQISNLVQKTIQKFGSLDIMVNNAGGSWIKAPMLELTEKYFDQVITLNLKGVFLGCKAAAQVMIKQKSGNIINISSTGAILPNPLNIPYSAAKAGVSTLTKNLAIELGPYNIRVNAILPGLIVTELTSAHADKDPAVFETRRKNTALGRLGMPEDIAGAAVYLASEASSYVTGALLIVSGGLQTLVT